MRRPSAARAAEEGVAQGRADADGLALALRLPNTARVVYPRSHSYSLMNAFTGAD
jgi:hypothetical protein